MGERYTDYADAINQIFELKFTEAYKSSNKKNRARILPYISTIFRRWYYAALVEDTYLTPANIFESLNRAYNRPPAETPAVTLRTPRNYTGLSFTARDYERHPVIDDLRRFIDYCLPDIALTEDDSLDDKQLAEAVKRLSLWDPHYAAYLLGIAISMNLIVKIPSIYSNRAQVATDYEARLSVADAELFDQITTATMKMAAYSLNELVPLPQPLFDERFIRSILKKPMETDFIFQRLYDIMGIKIEDLFDMDFDDDFDGLNAAVISGTFLLGIILDKFFFTPFSHYLNLIRPIYVLPFDFDSEIKYFLDSDFDEEELYTAFFAPCSQYSFTELGLAYFNVTPNEDNYVNVQEKLPFALIRRQLFQNKNMSRQPLPANLSLHPGVKQEIYLLKIKYLPDPAYWLYMEFPCDAPLHRLFMETAMLFNIDTNSDYSFFYDTSESPFSEYKSPKSTRRSKKVADVSLASLNFMEKHEFILAVYNHGDPFSLDFTRKLAKFNLRLSFELMKIKPINNDAAYPTVTRLSKAFKAFNTLDD